MFERRARGVLALLILACCGLLARAAQVQLVESESWQAAAEAALTRTSLTEAARGRLLDRHGQVIAHDVPCNDAAMAYWFVQDPPDPNRLWLVARDLARQTPGYRAATTAEQVRRVEAAMPEAQQRIDALWHQLATIGEVTGNEMSLRRRTILERVEARRRDVVLRRYQRAMAEHEQQDASPWWRKFLLGNEDAPPELAEFEEPIADEEQAHVVLRDISNEQYNQLVKLRADLLPTLSESLRLTAGSTRVYPSGTTAAHVVGRIGEVDANDIERDPELDDELRRFLPGDLTGKGGLEALAERQLRGTRGRIERDLAAGGRDIEAEPVAGVDVTTTLDLDLCDDVREAFNHVDFRWPAEYPGEPTEHRIEVGPMYGSAVVIDVESGGVLAMVSAPDYDANEYVELSQDLWADEMNRPLLNRATLFATTPGSTVKPLVGLGAISDGLIDPSDTICCDGHLHIHIDGKLTTFTQSFRCWTAKMFPNSVQGHQMPPQDPHPTPGLNPFDPNPGDLTFADAIQRSCNIFFETLGHQGGHEQLSSWLGQFGLGEPTGIGLPEKRGLTPFLVEGATAAEQMRSAIFGSMGQGAVEATPMQMADVAATLARDGKRLRPRLVDDGTRDVVDLGLDRVALDQMHRGMEAVVNTRGGSGYRINERLPVTIAGKTGSAQAFRLTLAERDLDGQPVRDDNGRIRYRRMDDLSTRGKPNPAAPWYRRSNHPSEERVEVTHAWFIGYAPADDPKVAFAVFVEYGGSGGYSAGSVAAQIVQALTNRGYLQAKRTPDPDRPGYFVVTH
ncbi:MAG: penicillin-binding transpeptidase domain-containing protein [Planctomycetota bacterium]